MRLIPNANKSDKKSIPNTFFMDDELDMTFMGLLLSGTLSLLALEKRVFFYFQIILNLPYILSTVNPFFVMNILFRYFITIATNLSGIKTLDLGLRMSL